MVDDFEALDSVETETTACDGQVMVMVSAVTPTSPQNTKIKIKKIKKLRHEQLNERKNGGEYTLGVNAFGEKINCVASEDDVDFLSLSGDACEDMDMCILKRCDKKKRAVKNLFCVNCVETAG